MEFGCSYNELTCLECLEWKQHQCYLPFYAVGNPNLTCIEVDDVNYSTTNWTDIDSQMSFSDRIATTTVPHQP